MMFSAPWFVVVLLVIGFGAHAGLEFWCRASVHLLRSGTSPAGFLSKLGYIGLNYTTRLTLRSYHGRTKTSNFHNRLTGHYMGGMPPDSVL